MLEHGGLRIGPEVKLFAPKRGTLRVGAFLARVRAGDSST